MTFPFRKESPFCFEIVPPALFLLLVLFCRPGLLAGNPDFALILIPRGAYALFACAFILFFAWKRFRAGISALSTTELLAWGILLVSGFAHFLWNGYALPEYLGENLLIFAIPAFGLCFREELLKLLPAFLSLLWFFNIALDIYYSLENRFLNGVPGNWNWSATLFVITTPFVFLYLFRYFRSRLLGKGFSGILAVLLPGPVTVYFFYRSQSRGAVLALFAGIAFMLLPLLPTKIRRIALISGTVLAAVGCAVMLFFAVRFENRNGENAEARPEIWKSSLKLIADHPLGTGAEKLEQIFVRCRNMEYFRCRNAAVRTVHPHNELLYLAAALGIPAMIAWIVLAAGGIFRFLLNPESEKRDGKRNLLFFAWIVLLTHGMFDLVLFAWPTFLIGGLLSGIFWGHPQKKGVPICCETETGFSKTFRIAAASGFLILALLDAVTAAIGTHALEKAKNLAVRDIESAGKYLKTGALLAPQCKEEVFNAVEKVLRAEGGMNDVLAALETFRFSPTPDYGNIHAYRANALARLGRDREAIGEYRKESEIFPHLIVPRIGLMTACVRLGMEKEADEARLEILRVMKERNIREEHLEFLLNDPLCDLQPYRIDEKLKKAKARP